MASYIMALTINPNAKKKHPNLSHHVNESIEILAKHKIHVDKLYATLGRYDFLVMFDVIDQAIVFSAASEINHLGVLDTETWPVIPFEEFSQIIE